VLKNKGTVFTAGIRNLAASSVSLASWVGVVAGWMIGAGSAHAAPPFPPVQFYGFVLPTVSVSSGGVESYSQPNMSAPTAAANPMMAYHSDSPVYSFQYVQSRAGVRLGDDQMSGRLEFDFIDFSKASPTVQALPRVRRATVEYSPVDSVHLLMGLDWDLVSPLGPFSFNYICHNFESGDIGFMRTQAMTLVKTGRFEHGFALGFPAANSTASAGILEQSWIPTIALRETYTAEKFSVGASGIITALRESAGGSNRYLAGAFTLFGWVKPVAGLEIRSEGYFGRNTANIGLLGLAYSDGGAALGGNEMGAYVSAKGTFLEKHSVFGGIGAATLLEPSQATPSYTVSSTGAVSLSGKGPGIELNERVNVGYQWKPKDWFSVFTEMNAFFTRHRLDATGTAQFENQRLAVIGTVGTQFEF
jgi:hypothetical protein